jgi:flagellin
MVELRAEIDSALGTAEFNGVKLFEGDGTAGSTKTLTFQVGAGSGDTFDVGVSRLDSTELGIAAAGYSTEVDAPADFGATGKHPFISAAAGTYAGAASSFTFEVKSIDATAGSEAVTFEVTGSDGSTQDYVYDASSGGAAAIDTTAAGILQGLTLSFTDADDAALNASAAANGYFEVGDAFTLDVKKGGLDVGTTAEAATTLTNIDAAIKKVSESVASLGDAQSRLSFKQTNLQTSMTNYEAARSRIADADFAKEQMEIVKLQILQQTGTASLAQANVAPQSVLSLLGQ